jgi:hypothetical protein
VRADDVEEASGGGRAVWVAVGGGGRAHWAVVSAVGGGRGVVQI